MKPPPRNRILAATRLTSLVLTLLAGVGLLACHAAPRAVSPPLRIGTYQWPGSYWINVAWKKGWFTEAGLNVARVDVDGNYFKGLDEVVAGKIDVMGFSQYDLVRRVAEGHDLVGVAAVDYSTGAEALVVNPSIHSLRDLKGKRLALYRGTYLEYLLDIVAQREGVDVSDVVLVNRNGEDAIADFKAGRVDGILLWDPYVGQAKAAGGVVLFSTDDIPGITYTVLSFRGEYLRQHPEQVSALLRVWDRAERYVREHPQESCEILSEYLKETVQSSLDLMRTVRVLDLADNQRAFSYAAGFESLHGSWRRMNDFMLQSGTVSLSVDSASHLDSEFIRMLE